MTPLSRRDFTRTLAAAALATSAGAPSRTQAQTQNAAGEMIAVKSQPRQTPTPFAAPLEFHRSPVPVEVEAFTLSEVQLGDGPLLHAREANRAYLKRLPIDRLLHTYRRNTGIPSDAKPLGGWADPGHPLCGEFAGHYLSAISMMSAATGDPELKSRTTQLVAGFAECQSRLNAGGCLSASPVSFFDQAVATPDWRRYGVPFYTLHKVMAGLEDAYIHTGNQQALEVAIGIGTWVDAWSSKRSEDQMQHALRVEFGGMADSLYVLADIAGNDRWAVVGDRFTKKPFMTSLALRRDELRGLHVNTHVPQVIGAARRYQLSGDPRFRTVAQFFYDTVTTSRSYVTGGSGVNEHWLADPECLGAEIGLSAQHQECCCAYNMMKLTRQLYQQTADARFFDFYERNLYNHRLGTIALDTGHTQYFLSQTSGAWRTFGSEDDTFWCCTGTGVQEYSKLNDAIYFHAHRQLYVNLFVPSSVDWAEQAVHFEQKTSFPDEPRTRFTVRTSSPSAWTLHLRVPGWIAEPASVKINGRALEATASPSSYLSIHRNWKDGDHIEMELPMKLSAEPLPDDPTRMAFLYGPIVLAGAFGEKGLTDELVYKHIVDGYHDVKAPDVSKAPVAVPALVAGEGALAEWIRPVGPKPLEFEITGQLEPVRLVPFYRTAGHYAIYWKVART